MYVYIYIYKYYNIEREHVALGLGLVEILRIEAYKQHQTAKEQPRYHSKISHLP